MALLPAGPQFCLRLWILGGVLNLSPLAASGILYPIELMRGTDTNWA
jgi:hypothetical protein